VTKVVRSVCRALSAALVPVISASLLVISAGEASAAWSQPSFVRSVGGIGRPGVFAWGLSYNPVTDEVIVGDYLNFRVRRYADGGARFLGDLPARPGEVWATGVDPRNGDIYYSSNWQQSIERFDRFGNHLATVRLSSGWNSWFDVDRNGDLWVVYGSPQSTSYQLQRYRNDGTRLNTWTLPNSFPKAMTIFGVGVTSDDRVYLPDSNNKQIQVYRFNRSSGALTFDRAFGSSVLGGDLRGIAIDEANGWVYTSDAAANLVRKFTLDGTFVMGIGGAGSTPGKFQAPRQLDVDPETGELYVADFGNWRFQRFGPNGGLIGAYPNPAQPAALGHLAHAADAVADPATGDLWVADTYNQRFQRFGPDGALTGAWGYRGGNPEYGQNYPSAIGFDPVNRRVWVGQEEGRVIKIYDDDGGYVATISRGPKTPENAGYTRNVTDIDFFGGKAYIADEQYDKIKVVDANTFVELAEIDVYNGSGWSGAHGLGIDPATGNLYVATYTEDRIKVYSPGGSLLRTFGTSGSGEGQFTSPRDVAIVGGVAYVTDADKSRVQAFSLDGTYLGKWGGIGTGPYKFRNPMGIDVVGSLLYVSDVENGRITVFDTAAPKPAFVFHKPTVTITAPADGQILAVEGPISVEGVAASTQFVGNVEISVQRASDGLWWNGRTASWEVAPTVNLAPWVATSAPATQASYAYVFPGAARGQSYRIEVVARNRQDTVSATKVATVQVSTELPPDTTAPNATLTSPARNATVPRGIVQLLGGATDDRAVGAVAVTIKDVDAGTYLRPNGSWGAIAWLPTVLASPGATASGWSLDVDLPRGNFKVMVRATDAAGNEDATKPNVPFGTS
jgi:sugar lactone lactonase YvrE